MAHVTPAGAGNPSDPVDEPTRVGRTRHWWQGVPLLVWLVTACWAALCAAYTFLYPPYLGWDEPQHVDMVVAVQHADGWPGPGQRTLSLGVATSSDWIYGGKYSRLPYSAHPLPPRGQRPSLDQLGDDQPSTGHLPNQIVQHPPAYYAIEAAVLTAIPGTSHWPYDRTLNVLRLVSVVLMAPVPLFCWMAARRFVPPHLAGAASVFPLTIPGLTRVAGSVNNDVLLVTTCCLLTALLAHVVTGDLRRRITVGAGGVWALALLAKGSALAFGPIVVVAYAVAAWRTRRIRTFVYGWPTYVGGVIGGAWYLRNKVMYGALQPDGFGKAALAQIEPPKPPGTPTPLHVPLHAWAKYGVLRFWSGLGLPEPPQVPSAVVWLATALVLAALAAALVLGVRKAGRRLEIAVMVAPLVVLWLATAAGIVHTYMRSAQLHGVQGRYLYPAIGGIAAAITVPITWLWKQVQRLAAAGMLVCAAAMQVLAFRAIIDDFWLPHTTASRLGHVADAFRNLAQWSPWPIGITAIPFALIVLAGLAAFGVAVQRAIKPASS